MKARQNLRKRANALHKQWQLTPTPELLAQWRRLQERMGVVTDWAKAEQVEAAVSQ